MFRSSTIIRELALNLAKVIFMLKHSVKLRRYLLYGCVAACCHIKNARRNKNKFLDCLTPEDKTNILTRNNGRKLPFHAA